LGRDAATGRGGVIAFAELLNQLGKSDQNITYAVQGFGNVGQFFATVAEKEHPNWKLVAASDSGSTVYSQSGLDAQDLAKFKQENGRFSDYKNAERLKPEEVTSLSVDVLVLAALEDAVNEDNMKNVQAKYIVEMANGPITGAADKYLTSQAIIILPDIIANAGGVIVSYLEWVQNKSGEKWSEEKVNKELEKYMIPAVDKMYKTAKEENVPLKEAAFMVALKNLS
jgi:glutamate dehydrogenase/leucine dehydrogenase